MISLTFGIYKKFKNIQRAELGLPGTEIERKSGDVMSKGKPVVSYDEYVEWAN